MRPDLDIYGVYIPTFAFIALGCYALYTLLHRLLSAVGFYRHVWHQALFDIAMYFSLLGVAILVLEYFSR